MSCAGFWGSQWKLAISCHRGAERGPALRRAILCQPFCHSSWIDPGHMHVRSWYGPGEILVESWRHLREILEESWLNPGKNPGSCQDILARFSRGTDRPPKRVCAAGEAGWRCAAGGDWAGAPPDRPAGLGEGRPLFSFSRPPAVETPLPLSKSRGTCRTCPPLLVNPH